GASGLLAAAACGAPGRVLWRGGGNWARDEGPGLKTVREAVPAKPASARRQWVRKLVGRPPLRWWLRDPVARATFLLVTAYLFRDRDMKLRVYPALAPMLVMPIIFSVRKVGGGADGMGFGMAFSGAFLGLIPMLGMDLLQYSQQWRAAEVFRAAPMPGPAALSHGARRAVLFFTLVPLLILLLPLAWVTRGD